MRQYLDLMEQVIINGEEREDRTGVGTLSLFGSQMEFDLREGFPLLTTKRLHVRSIIHELLWMLRGDTNIASLQREGVSIWDEWADGAGDLGPVYGAQWRRWRRPEGQGRVDQIAELVRSLTERPSSRRHLVTAWNPGEL